MRSLRREERIFLKAFLASCAVLGSIGVVAASCLDRDRSSPSEPPFVQTTGATSSASNAEDAGAPPAAELSESTSTAAPPPPEDTSAAEADAGARPDAAPRIASAPDVADAGAPTAADAGAPAQAPAARAIIDAGAPPPPPVSTYMGPSFSAGAGPFATEPPSYGASAWEANPEAGAGPFTTERNMPGVWIFYGVPPPPQ
jgi:hypothetical protein